MRSNGERIRIGGIYAPEARLLCQRNSEQWRRGKEASNVLHDCIGGELVRCAVENDEIPQPWGVWIEKEYGLSLPREAARRQTGLDVGTWMALARATPTRSDDATEQPRF